MDTPVTRRKPSGRRRPLADQPSARPDAAEIYAVVAAIPRGRVATYGEVAELAGIPRGHRIVARAMRACPSGLPWQRVVAKKDPRRAKIGIVDPDAASEQRRLLEAEGVAFDADGALSLCRSGWLPR
ncbi:MAG: MGMT family protein [Myxococcales bacterium]|nr:MGMT family protein [Myxococcales bacterium]